MTTRPYRVLGPLDVPDGDDRYIDAHDLNGFWPDVDARRQGLSTAHGVYVFAMKAARGFTPWYVGKATGRKGFRQEVFAPHKLIHYNAVYRRYRRGRPVIFLVYPVTAARDAIRQPQAGEVEWVEQFLIATAIEANPSLRNHRGTSNLRLVQIPGLHNSIARGDDISYFLRTMNRWRSTLRRPGEDVAPVDLHIEPVDVRDQDPELLDPETVLEIEQVPTNEPFNWTEFLFGPGVAGWLARANARREARRKGAVGEGRWSDGLSVSGDSDDDACVTA